LIYLHIFGEQNPSAVSRALSNRLQNFTRDSLSACSLTLHRPLKYIIAPVRSPLRYRFTLSTYFGTFGIKRSVLHRIQSGNARGFGRESDDNWAGMYSLSLTVATRFASCYCTLFLLLLGNLWWHERGSKNATRVPDPSAITGSFNRPNRYSTAL